MGTLTGAIKRLPAIINRLWPQYLQLPKDLVRQPTVLGQERGAQEILLRHLRRMALPAEMYDLDLGALGQHPQFTPTGWYIKDARM